MRDEIAVLMAAGMGIRMLPLTKDTAKPLIKVCGTPMIETIIDALTMRRIKTIYVVVGYLKEQFEYLTDKYANVVLVENREYLHKNNISSIKAVEEMLGEEHCFVCEADLFIRDRAVFLHDHAQSCYFGKFVSGYSGDWVFELIGGRITEIRKGGNDLYNMAGVSYWLKDDIRMVRDAVRRAYNKPAHKELFWDEVVNRELRSINLGVFPIGCDQITEIDTTEELERVQTLI